MTEDGLGHSETPPAGRSAHRLVYNVPEAGALAGLGRNASYDAAKRGEIPTLRLGGRLLVPKKKWDAMLAGEAS
jgi:hypothetical protein